MRARVCIYKNYIVIFLKRHNYLLHILNGRDIKFGKKVAILSHCAPVLTAASGRDSSSDAVCHRRSSQARSDHALYLHTFTTFQVSPSSFYVSFSSTFITCDYSNRNIFILLNYSYYYYY